VQNRTLVADKLARAKLARAALRLAGKSQLAALVLMTDDERLPDPLSAARMLPRGSMVIVRARDTEKRHGLVTALKPVACARNLKLLVAGDAALAVQADGIHLPQVRAKEAAHWRALHPRWIITIAAHSRVADVSGADAVLLSPIFPTESHPGGKHIGAARARLIARAMKTPVYALGGVSATNADGLRGFSGVAAIGALA
jgi:thiamine-phosphate pyrophosphorylase